MINFKNGDEPTTTGSRLRGGATCVLIRMSFDLTRRHFVSPPLLRRHAVCHNRRNQNEECASGLPRRP